MKKGETCASRIEHHVYTVKTRGIFQIALSSTNGLPHSVTKARWSPWRHKRSYMSRFMFNIRPASSGPCVG